MRLEDDALDALLDDIEETVDEARVAEPGVQPGKRAVHAAYVEHYESIYSALSELRAWREQFPDVRIEPVFETPFGLQRVQ